MKKILFVATVTKHINSFHIPYLKMFKENGYEVHVASNGEEPIKYCDKHYNLEFARFPLKLQNYKVYKELKKIINENNYEIIHCHTPVGGVLARLATKNARKNGTRVIYTAHGFHFYKGAPLLNWLIYYPIEKWLSKYTDCLITINQEDYDRAKKKFKKCKQIELVHGVGLDTTKFDIEITEEELETLRKGIGINKENIVLTYVAELNKNKNQILLIKTTQELIKENDNYRLVLVGDGNKRIEYEKYIKKYNLEKYIKLLGKRTDIPQILKLTNVYVASSLREGLPVNILEAMYMGLPVVTTDNRGHRELIINGKTGILLKENNAQELIKQIRILKSNNAKRQDVIDNARIYVVKYKSNKVLKEIQKMYFLKTNKKECVKKVYRKKEIIKNKFSIIVPIYNSEIYLKKCLNSIINQNYSNMEIILVDDGSKDNSGHICDEYAKNDKRITVIHKENGGVSAARNAGIKSATGQYILFVDSDDYIKEGVLEQLNKIYVENKDVDVIIFKKLLKDKIEYIQEKQEIIKKISDLIKKEKINSPWGICYSKSIIDINNIMFDTNLQIAEDLLFNMIYIKHVKSIYMFPTKYYQYFVENDNSLTRKYKEKKYEQLIKVNDELKKWANDINNKNLLEIQKYIRIKNIFSCFFDLFHKDCILTTKKKLGYIKKIKTENKKIIIYECGVKVFMLSCIYSYSNKYLLFVISKIIAKRKLRNNYYKK